jgi:mitochondrial fission protein ELM1
MKWPFVAFQLEFNFMNRLPNPLLGRSLMSLSGQGRAKLKPPFPDLVIGMGRRIVPVARWIKRQSGGRSRIALLGRKAMGNPADIDLLVGCVHFNQLPREKFFVLVVPPTQVNADSLATAREARPNPMAKIGQPRIVLLVGGPTVQHRFDATDASQMASQVSRAAVRLGGGLAIVTSRRTPVAAVEAMRRAVPDAQIHTWEADVRDNPYLSYLAHTDLLVVTGESESMIAEAAATGLPLTIFPLQAKPPGVKNDIASAVRRWAEKSGMLASLCRYVLLAGWIVPPRELALMHEAMVQRGMAHVFDGSLNTRKPGYSDAFELLVSRLTDLVAGGR